MQHIPNLPGNGNHLKFTKMALQIMWIFFLHRLPDSFQIICQWNMHYAVTTPHWRSRASLKLSMRNQGCQCILRLQDCFTIETPSHAYFCHFSWRVIMVLWVLCCWVEHQFCNVFLMFPKESMIFWQTLFLFFVNQNGTWTAMHWYRWNKTQDSSVTLTSEWVEGDDVLAAWYFLCWLVGWLVWLSF